MNFKESILIYPEQGDPILICKGDFVAFTTPSNGDKVGRVISIDTSMATIRVDCSEQYHSKIVTAYISQLDVIQVIELEAAQ